MAQQPPAPRRFSQTSPKPARAARLVTDWGFEIGMVRMIAGTAPDNVASQRVLEAAGYHREGLQFAKLPGPDGTRIDNIQFAKLRPHF